MINQDMNVIVGLGLTGFSVARFLKNSGIPFAVNDTRVNPPSLSDFKNQFPDVPISLGQLDRALFNKASRLIMSPGVSIKEPLIAEQIKRGISVIGDIELLALHTKVPMVAITGTNAKSTVTTLVGKMAENAGLRVAVGGNLGIPALDLINNNEHDLFVLELSSFQLETTFSLAPKVATVLNVTPDHMDRYDTLEEYIRVKRHVYHQASSIVYNRDDANTDSVHPKKMAFTLNQPEQNEFGLLKKNDETYLAFEDQILLPQRELPILGRHYQANALAALAIGFSLGLPVDPMLQTLTTFKGLAHRCELVRDRMGVVWYNDSKGTNVGATLAAMAGLGGVIQGRLILIAGGLGKNADFSPLVPVMEQYVKTVILIGDAAPILAETINQRVPVQFAKSMEEAVQLADRAANPDDCVLLSPACASYDMFKNFEHRGQVFSALVNAL